ncbi:Epidermal growth factor-like domain and Immunoglobulin-like fold domain-containing protein [Strongyloides ratti]|uniref:Epidermal growth factor-like domain and Immunoglobulin-like fold domain-containing protein n=1 Tax=Strongyloides ratti TaxID=34506 RepID=A0A090KTJ3_STRRB|nr:Epidermal growth factor-like domain and Immunoglobulin-like fold domain-containing protein [Strongyloides ratti]CEF60691.1 Epidermal growth factor-like domain and Immunoglobulin-like fold domain-containing protein [Strongyloides ratti]
MHLKVLIFVLVTNLHLECRTIKLTFNQEEGNQVISYFHNLDKINITCEAGQGFTLEESKILYNNKEIPSRYISRQKNSTTLIIQNFVPNSPESKFECVLKNTFDNKTKSLKVIFYKMCTINQCLNGGTCFVQGNVEFCQCPYEYHGTFCEKFIPDINLFGIFYKNGMQLPASTIVTLLLLIIIILCIFIFWYITTYTKWGVKKIHKFYLKRHRTVVMDTVNVEVKDKNETIKMDESNYDLAINNKIEDETPFIDDPGQNYDNLNPKVCQSMYQMKLNFFNKNDK